MREREWIMLALRFMSVVVGDKIAGRQIRMYGVDPQQFSRPFGFFRVRIGHQFIAMLA